MIRVRTGVVITSVPGLDWVRGRVWGGDHYDKG